MTAAHERHPVSGRAAAKPTVIYGLCDPETGALRYVGKTCTSMQRRLQQHVTTARLGKARWRSTRWIASLVCKGFAPDAFELEVIAAGGDWMEAEQHWIRTMRALGCDLTNHADGGQGTDGYRFTAEQIERLKASHAGQPRNPETVAKFKAAMAAKAEAGWQKPAPSPDAVASGVATRAALRAAGLMRRRRRATEDERQAASVARRAVDTPEMRARIAEGKRRADDAKRAATGHAVPPEVRARISESMKQVRAAQRLAHNSPA